jgi:hypothetical protein
MITCVFSFWAVGLPDSEAFRKANVVGSISTVGLGGTLKVEDVVSMAMAMGAKIYPLEVPVKGAQ